MRQSEPLLIERRDHPRQTKAFSFWIRPFGTRHRASAWMENVSDGGAAFLIEPEQAPQVGQRIELIEMTTRDRTVREDACPLPMYAVVVRRQDQEGATARVAVRFEVGAGVGDDAPRHDHAATARCVQAPAPVPPPVATVPDITFPTKRPDAPALI
jgi:hypothetical protein